MIISIDEIIDYTFCPIKYLLKYKYKNIKTQYVDLIEKYDRDIHKVIYYSFSKVQDGSVMRIEDIKTAWGRHWIKDKRKHNIVFIDTLFNKDTYNERRKKGYESLLNFHKKFSCDPYLPILIDYPYELKINDDLTITGNIELVRKIENDILQLCVFKTDEHTHNKPNNNYDLRLMASSLALSHIVENKIEIMTYHVDKASSRKHIIKESKDIFLASVKQICKAIKNKIFYISPSTKCNSCIYKDICSDYKIINNILKEKCEC